MEKEIIKGYKGFDKNLKCRDKQYAIGETFTENHVKLCYSGMHFCENPHDIFTYYEPGNNNRFCKVEASDVSDEREDDSKRVAKTLSVKDEISVFQICKIAVSIFFKNFDFEEKIESADCKVAGYRGSANAGNYGAANAGSFGAANAGYRGSANAGDCGAANAGSFGAANAGDCGAANAGEGGAANAGDCGAANAGEGGAANAGDRGAANAGYHGAANAGDSGAANAGDFGVANARDYGAASAGDNSVAVVSNEGKVKGGLGCILVARNIEYNIKINRFEVTDWACAIVDGEKIKVDTWYHLVNGELKEVEQVD